MPSTKRAQRAAPLFRRTTLPSADWQRTLAHVSNVLTDSGFHVFTTIDHARVAPTSLPPTTNIYFGSPQQGTPLMRRDPALAAVLPMVASLHQRTPTTHVTCTLVNPFARLSKYHDVAKHMDKKLLDVLKRMRNRVSS